MVLSQCFYSVSCQGCDPLNIAQHRKTWDAVYQSIMKLRPFLSCRCQQTVYGANVMLKALVMLIPGVLGERMATAASILSIKYTTIYQTIVLCGAYQFWKKKHFPISWVLNVIWGSNKSNKKQIDTTRAFNKIDQDVSPCFKCNKHGRKHNSFICLDTQVVKCSTWSSWQLEETPVAKGAGWVQYLWGIFS